MTKRIPLTEIEGAISVQGDITPISRQPVENITADKWADMSVLQLSQQRHVLSQRLYFAQRNGLYEGAKTIQMGIAYIDALMEDKGGEGIEFI
jgi:hypothetical protein